MRLCPQCRSIYPPEIEYCPTDGARIADEPHDPLLGSVIDNRYMLTERLGAGTSGAVYRAKHTVLAHEYAVKVLYGDLAMNATVAERFRREAQTISRLRHPNVVDIIDYGATAEGLIFLVLEMLKGRTLLDLIQREAPFEMERAASIARQIASGLGEVHKFGFVHRDLKPGNVMILSEGGKETAKILDFGLVGKEERNENENRLTHHGVTVGTPLYMAPEQCMKADVSPRADLYSLGVILYEMIGGKRPFDGPVQTVIIAHMTERPKPLVRGGPLADLAMQLLEKSALKRPQDAAEVVEIIDRLFPPEETRQVAKWQDTVEAPELPELSSWARHTREDDPTRPGQRSKRSSVPTHESRTVTDEPTPPENRPTSPDTPAEFGSTPPDLGVTLLEGDDADAALIRKVEAAMSGNASSSSSGPTALPGQLQPPPRSTAPARSSQRGAAALAEPVPPPRTSGAALPAVTAKRKTAELPAAPPPPSRTPISKPPASSKPTPAATPPVKQEPAGAPRATGVNGAAAVAAPAPVPVPVPVPAQAPAPAPPPESLTEAAEDASRKKRLLMMFSFAALVTSGALVVLIATPALWPTLDVTSDPPGASIIVDGVISGMTTPARVRVRPGEAHHLRVEGAGKRAAEIETGPMARGHAGAHLVCLGEPDRRVAISPVAGRVFVNGAAAGAGTDLLLPRLPAGPITIRVESNGYRTWSNTFPSAADVPAAFDVALTRAP